LKRSDLFPLSMVILLSKRALGAITGDVAGQPGTNVVRE